MLEQTCRIVTHVPARCSGPLPFRAAVRSVVEHRPPAERVELHLEAGGVLGEDEIQALYALASLSIAEGSALLGAGETPSAS